MSTTKVLSKRFNNVLEDHFLRLVELEEERMSFQPPEGKWSGKEILGHLIDSASNNYQRFVRTPLKDDMIFEGYDQDEWVRSQNYGTRNWNDVLNLWHHYNLHLFHLISQMTDETLNKKYSAHNLDKIAFKSLSKAKSATLSYFIEDYIDHMIHHLEQIYQR